MVPSRKGGDHRIAVGQRQHTPHVAESSVLPLVGCREEKIVLDHEFDALTGLQGCGQVRQEPTSSIPQLRVDGDTIDA